MAAPYKKLRKTDEMSQLLHNTLYNADNSKSDLVTDRIDTRDGIYTVLVNNSIAQASTSSNIPRVSSFLQRSEII